MKPLSELLDAATPRPWAEVSGGVITKNGRRFFMREDAVPNAALIVALVNNAADILALIEAADLCVDDDPCSFDHHGYCQAHGLGDMGDRDTPHCPTRVARDALDRLKPLVEGSE